MKTSTAYFAAGCFWGVQYHFQRAKGVISTLVGYMGGVSPSPSYQEVKKGTTEHYEAIQVIYSPEETSYEELLRLFFEIHDFTQTDGQGMDIGSQYRSAIFTSSPQEIALARHYFALLSERGYIVATALLSEAPFWPAESYHQDYHKLKGDRPFCHIRRPLFSIK